MGRRYEETDEKCHLWKGKLKRVYEKNPFIDDFSEDCLDKDCSEFMAGSEFLTSTSRNIARSEEDRDE